MEFLSPKDVLEGRAPRNAQFVDVREDVEYGRLRWSLFANIPLSGIERRFGELDPSRPVVLLCKVGMRSLKAGIFLQRMGFAHVWNVDGGLDAALEEGAPLDGPDSTFPPD
jgi:rhodanese-related sulfurtransferase